MCVWYRAYTKHIIISHEGTTGASWYICMICIPQRPRCVFIFILLINPLLVAGRCPVRNECVVRCCRRSPWTLAGITIFIGTFRWNAYTLCVYWVYFGKRIVFYPSHPTRKQCTPGRLDGDDDDSLSRRRLDPRPTYIIIILYKYLYLSPIRVLMSITYTRLDRVSYSMVCIRIARRWLRKKKSRAAVLLQWRSRYIYIIHIFYTPSILVVQLTRAEAHWQHNSKC